MSALVRLLVSTTTVGALLVGAAPPSVAAPSAVGAPAEDGRPLSVQELPLKGVAPTAVEDLPTVAPQPEESQPVAETGLRARSFATAPVPEAPAPEVPAPDVLTEEMDTRDFSVLGVTWDAGPEDVVVRYRVRQAETWSDWAAVGAGDVAPDAQGQDSARTGDRTGTDPIVAEGADGLQLWVEAASGTVTGLKAVLVDPGVQATDADPARLSAAAVPVPGQPAIVSRAGWGADESMRRCDPDFSPVVHAAAVHHTASANGYSAESVPGLLRGFLAYHTRPEAEGGRGWCDIGYNFLVDRFGRIFEGRAGGVSATVVGVHTGGFNSRTFGVAAIGEYGSVGVPDVMTEAIASLIAWKFSIHGITAGSDVTLVSGGGASKWPAGASVTFSTIFGHRDAQLTSCPGNNLYGLLPYLRTRVAQLANASVGVSPIGSWDSYSTTGSSITASGWAADPETAAPIAVEVRVDGVLTTTGTANLRRPDVAVGYPALGPDHGFSVRSPVAPGAHVVCLAAVNVGQGTNVSLGCRWITVRNSSPVGVVDHVAAVPGGITVAGWALDPDTSDPIEVHVYVDGVGVSLRADVSRPDVGAAFQRGDRHGFVHERSVDPGVHRACVYAIDSEGGPPTLLACQDVSVRGLPSAAGPMLDLAVPNGSGGSNLWEMALGPGTWQGSPFLLSRLEDGGFSHTQSRSASGDLGVVSSSDDGTPDWLVSHRQPNGGILMWVVGGGPGAVPRVWADLRSGGWSWDDSRQLVGDVTGDGIDDIVSVHRNGRADGTSGVNVWVHRGTGSGLADPVLWASEGPDLGLPAGSRPAQGARPFVDSRFMLGDVDGDGRHDLVVTARPSAATTAVAWTTWRSTGTSFAVAAAASATAPAAEGWSFDGSRDLLADTDGDGRAELVTVHVQPAGGILVWHRGTSAGGQQFGTPTVVDDLRTGGWSFAGSRQAAADTDGDGRDDLVSVHEQPTGGMIVWAHRLVDGRRAAAPAPVAELPASAGWSFRGARESVGLYAPRR